MNKLLFILLAVLLANVNQYTTSAYRLGKVSAPKRTPTASLAPAPAPSPSYGTGSGYSQTQNEDDNQDEEGAAAGGNSYTKGLEPDQGTGGSGGGPRTIQPSGFGGNEGPSGSEEPEHPAPEPYAFNYEVHTDDGASVSREETGTKEGVVTGYYMLMGADGNMRRVNYIADKDGFRATITTNELGTESKNPADVVIESTADNTSGPSEGSTSAGASTGGADVSKSGAEEDSADVANREAAGSAGRGSFARGQSPRQESELQGPNSVEQFSQSYEPTVPQRPQPQAPQQQRPRVQPQTQPQPQPSRPAQQPRPQTRTPQRPQTQQPAKGRPQRPQPAQPVRSSPTKGQRAPAPRPQQSQPRLQPVSSAVQRPSLPAPRQQPLQPLPVRPVQTVQETESASEEGGESVGQGPAENNDYSIGQQNIAAAANQNNVYVTPIGGSNVPEIEKTGGQHQYIMIPLTGDLDERSIAGMLNSGNFGERSVHSQFMLNEQQLKGLLALAQPSP